MFDPQNGAASWADSSKRFEDFFSFLRNQVLNQARENDDRCADRTLAVFDVTSGPVLGAPAPRDVADMTSELAARTSKSKSKSGTPKPPNDRQEPPRRREPNENSPLQNSDN